LQDTKELFSNLKGVLNQPSTERPAELIPHINQCGIVKLVHMMWNTYEIENHFEEKKGFPPNLETALEVILLTTESAIM